MNSETGNQSHWIPLADLMTGLMMIFMLLTAAFMLRVEQTTTLVVQEFQITKNDLTLALQKEFATDLKYWNAEVLGDMTIRFNDPTVLFATGSSELRPQFKKILRDFFPRYVNLITSDKYKNAVKEVRIEGHTSTFWASSMDPKVAYIKNMELSQARTRSALEFLLSLDSIAGQQSWLIQRVTANGLSSSHPLLVSKNNSELEDQINQRVEFRIVTTAGDKMDEIAKELERE